MKATLFTIALIALTSCTATQQTAEQVSWQAFCTQNGYALNDNSETTINTYLDTWCGSANEEAALNAAGITF